ncbi:MAG: YgiT-type zinc finger protein [Pseudomonadota bacterium]|nr:YgiT-type zinc finger protein [Pseudomonadota bacterium]
MKPFEKCPVCGGELESRQVDEIVRGGTHTALLRVPAEVCMNCGECLYTEDVAFSLDEIRDKLDRQEFTHLRVLGRSFTVDDDWPNKAVRPAN